MGRTHRLGVTMMTTLPFALAGCSDGHEREELIATWYLSHLDGQSATHVTAIFDHWPEYLPTMGSTAAVMVNGAALTPPCCTPAGFPTHIFDGQVGEVEAGQPYELVVDLPWQPTTSTIEMIHPAELTAPLAGSQIPTDQDLEVTWSSATPGEVDRVFLRVHVLGSSIRPVFGGIGMPPDSPDETPIAVAEDGEARVTVPASTLESWANGAANAMAEFVSPGEEVQWALVLSRSSSVVNGELFEANNIWLESEVATIPIAPLTLSAD
jgi:hypothetical protein